MPVCFQFEDGNGNAVELEKIDNEMCKDSRYPRSDHSYCPLMIWVQMIGTALESWAGGINPLNLNLKLAEHEHDGRDKYTAEERAILHKYLCDKYQYKTWHQR